MATPSQPGPNGHGTSSHPNPHSKSTSSTDELLERELLVLAQSRLLRERPAELLGALNSYVSYELGRRTQQGQLDHEDVLRDEVIDASFAAALTRLEQGDPIRDVPSFLRGRAQDTISREVRRVRFERQRNVSLEQTVSAGEEGEGGEDVRVADVIPDPQAREPEQIVIDNETLQFLIEALSDVPDLWRTVFLQRTMQERTAREVAEREGLDIDEVRRITLRTREFLRERMAADYDAAEE